MSSASCGPSTPGLDDLRRTRGRLVLIGSVNAYLALAGSSPYSMSKFALRALADSLRHELAREGVSVTLVNPGFVESEISPGRQPRRAAPRCEEPRPGRGFACPPERAARQIVRAVRRRRAEVGVTRHGKARDLPPAPRAEPPVERRPPLLHHRPARTGGRPGLSDWAERGAVESGILGRLTPSSSLAQDATLSRLRSRVRIPPGSPPAVGGRPTGTDRDFIASGKRRRPRACAA